MLYPNPEPKGGPYVHLINVKCQLEKMGHEVWVPRFTKIQRLGRPHSYAFNLLIVKNFNQIIRDFDVVHCMSGGGASFSLYRKISSVKKPLVTTYHGSWFRLDSVARQCNGYGVRDLPTWLMFHPVEERTKKLALSEADRVLAVSGYVKKTLICDYKIPDEKIEVCYNGVDAKYFQPIGETLLENKANPVVLYAGDLISRKGIGFLLKAIPRVLKEAEADFAFAGDGYWRLIIEDTSRRLGFRKNVKFLGHIPYDKMPTAYRSCDLYVLPSLMESFGLTVAEAMACGKPVIATNVGGISEIVQQRKTGILVRPGDIEGLAEAMIELLSDSRLASRYGKEGRGIVTEKFTWEAVAKRVLQVYEEVSN